MTSVVVVPRDAGTWYIVLVNDAVRDTFLNHGPPLSPMEMRSIAKGYKEYYDGNS